MSLNIRPDQELPPGAEDVPVNTEAFPPEGTEARRDMLIAQALPPSAMSTDEKLNEILVILREGQKLVTKYVDDMASGKLGGALGMFAQMMGGKR